MSKYICGHCGKDTRKTDMDAEKVSLAGYTDILCGSCRMLFTADIQVIAKKYLRNSPKLQETK